MQMINYTLNVLLWMKRKIYYTYQHLEILQEVTHVKAPLEDGQLFLKKKLLKYKLAKNNI